ncbi:hypothetical protein MTBSS4_40024 [Magnetospirillum sp. SS-4]|nr:hypothetical protein MTBSS4_40024 [Magnetospirillum sp. SS-4]
MKFSDHYIRCINSAARHYTHGEYINSFRTIIDALRENPLHLKAQTIAVASLTKVGDDILSRFVATWAATCRFGNLENATAILLEIFNEHDNTYDLFAGLSILSLRMGGGRNIIASVRRMSHRRTAHAGSPRRGYQGIRCGTL